MATTAASDHLLKKRFGRHWFALKTDTKRFGVHQSLSGRREGPYEIISYIPLEHGAAVRAWQRDVKARSRSTEAAGKSGNASAAASRTAARRRRPSQRSYASHTASSMTKRAVHADDRDDDSDSDSDNDSANDGDDGDGDGDDDDLSSASSSETDTGLNSDASVASATSVISFADSASASDAETDDAYANAGASAGGARDDYEPPARRHEPNLRARAPRGILKTSSSSLHTDDEGEVTNVKTPPTQQLAAERIDAERQYARSNPESFVAGFARIRFDDGSAFRVKRFDNKTQWRNEVDILRSLDRQPLGTGTEGPGQAASLRISPTLVDAWWVKPAAPVPPPSNGAGANKNKNRRQKKRPKLYYIRVADFAETLRSALGRRSAHGDATALLERALRLADTLDANTLLHGNLHLDALVVASDSDDSAVLAVNFEYFLDYPLRPEDVAVFVTADPPPELGWTRVAGYPERFTRHDRWNRKQLVAAVNDAGPAIVSPRVRRRLLAGNDEDRFNLDAFRRAVARQSSRR